MLNRLTSTYVAINSAKEAYLSLNVIEVIL